VLPAVLSADLEGDFDGSHDVLSFAEAICHPGKASESAFDVHNHSYILFFHSKHMASASPDSEIRN